MNTITLVMLVYLGFLLLIGIIASKHNRNLADQILGSRRLGPAVTALNAGASDMSSWLLMGLPGAFYLYGANQIWMIIGLVCGSFASWSLIAKRLRKYSQIAGNSLTISSFLEHRFRDASGILRFITSIVMVFFFTIYMASGFVGGAKLFSGMLDINYHTALIICSIFTVSYTILGGFIAISWADTFQGILMLFSLLIVPCVMISNIGGLEVTWHKLSLLAPKKLDVFDGVSAVTFISLFAWGLGYFGQPHIISKYMAINKADGIKKARNICISWMSISMLGAASIGILGIVQYPNISNHEMLFIQSSYDFFKPIFTGVLLCAVLSAIMSTINAQLLLCSSGLSQDIIGKFIKDLPDGKLCSINRIGIILFTLVAIVLALDESNTVLGMVKYAWGGIGSSIGPVIICALFFHFITRNAAVIGVLSGGISAIAMTKIGIPASEAISFLASFCIIVIYSLFDKKNRIPQAKKEIADIR